MTGRWIDHVILWLTRKFDGMTCNALDYVEIVRIFIRDMVMREGQGSGSGSDRSDAGGRKSINHREVSSCLLWYENDYWHEII